tara:strand:+ start:21 stop:1589 length:1569 start_codon:yes stop_codon:yes gene_type:complete
MAEKKHFSQSLADRLYVAEFDDALLDLKGWKNSRWEGSKLKGLKINEYNGAQVTGSGGIGIATIGSTGFTVGVWEDGNYGGDITYGLNPVINNETTAIYIANSIIGGTEDKQFATIENHSYVGIDKILIVNTDDNTVKIIDRETEPFESFNRFMTSDFPTGGKLNIKILDPSIQSNLKSNYHCKMNKGWLLSTFKYLNYTNDNGSLNEWDNPLELFGNASITSSNVNANGLIALSGNRLAFKFGIKPALNPPISPILGLSLIPAAITLGSTPISDFSPNYTKATIINNKFTKQYYSGSYSFPSTNTGYDGAFFSASRFILNDTVQFLNNNFEKTEIHLTINKGTKDFAPDWNDERSIGTFELDRGYGASAGISKNDHLDGSATVLEKYMGHKTPFYPILQLKGGYNYTPTITPNYNSSILGLMLQVSSQEYFAEMTHERDSYWTGNEAPQEPYSGSAAFELSFLDKDHTLIVDIDKDKELFDGIGVKGVALIPQYLQGTIKNNLSYYLKKAGIIDNAPTTQA